MIDQTFGVDHDGYLYDAEFDSDYADTEDDSSNTNTDSEASLEDAPESAPAHALAPRSRPLQAAPYAI